MLCTHEEKPSSEDNPRLKTKNSGHGQGSLPRGIILHWPLSLTLLLIKFLHTTESFQSQRSSTVRTKLEVCRIKRGQTWPTLQLVSPVTLFNRPSSISPDVVEFPQWHQKWTWSAFHCWIVAAPLPHRDEEHAKHIVILNQRRWGRTNRANRCFTLEHRLHFLSHTTKEEKKHHGLKTRGYTASLKP
jgi:hypothetical protein